MLIINRNSPAGINKQNKYFIFPLSNPYSDDFTHITTGYYNQFSNQHIYFAIFYIKLILRNRYASGDGGECYETD